MKRNISIVNEGTKFNADKYETIFADFDKDGTLNIDDAYPLDKSKKARVEEIALEETFRKLIEVKGELDTIMYEAVDTLDKKSPIGADIYARTKTPYSIIKKLVEKRMLDPKKGLTDMVGTTIAVDNQEQLEELRDKIDGGLLGKVLDRDDFYKNPNAGYRAYHYIVEYKGIPIEVQLKTKIMKKLNEVSHEFYKNGNLNAKGLDDVSKIFEKADKGDFKSLAQVKVLLSDKSKLASKISIKMQEGGAIAKLKKQMKDSIHDDYYANGGSLARGGEIKGRNNQTGETYDVVVGSMAIEDNLKVVNVRNSYSTRISEYKLSFDENNNLYEIIDYGYILDGLPNNLTNGSGKTINAKNKKETVAAISFLFNKSFAEKIYTLISTESQYAKGGSTASDVQENKMKHPKSHYQSLPTYSGYKWFGFEKGKHLFQQKANKGYYSIKASEEDLENGNIEFMAEHGLSNTNKFTNGGDILREFDNNNSTYAKGGSIDKDREMKVTKITDIPNLEQEIELRNVTYRGLGLGKLFDRFYDVANESGTRIKVKGKEYYITETDFDKISRGSDGKLRIKFDAPLRTYAKGGSTARGGNIEVAQTIATQLGGTSRLQAFTGAYNFGTSGNNLTFRIKNRKVNYVRITLNSKDLYDLQFGRVSGVKFTVIKEYNDIYNDQLVELFEQTTGMYLSFKEGGEVQKANMGYLAIAQGAKDILPKSVDSLDSKIANRVDKKSFWQRINETGVPEIDNANKDKYAKGGELNDGQREKLILLARKRGFIK